MALEPTPRKSLDEIAAMMAENTIQMRREHAEAGVPLDEEVVEDNTTEVPDVDAGADSDNTADVDDDLAAVEDGNDDASDDDADGSDEQALDADDAAAEDDDVDDPQLGDNEFEIDDTDLLVVGEENVSIADLKALYESDKHILAKVQEQDEATKEAAVERQRAIEDSQKARVAVEAVFQHITNIATQPLVSVPDEALKTSDPARYIQHLEAYQQDQQRIQASKSDLEQAMEVHANQQKELKEHYKRAELLRLQKHIPALVSNDEKVRQVASKDILNAAERYGFSPEEVNEAVDSRVYRMAYDAAQYHKLMQGGKVEQEDTERKLKTRVKQRTRTLHSRGTSAKNRLSAKAKQVKILKTQAQKSGKVDDVAALIAAQKSA